MPCPRHHRIFATMRSFITSGSRTLVLTWCVCVCTAERPAFNTGSLQPDTGEGAVPDVTSLRKRRAEGFHSEGTVQASHEAGRGLLSLVCRTSVWRDGKKLLQNATGVGDKGLSATFPSWLQGVLLCLLSSTLTSLGVVLQKYSHVRQSGQKEENGAYYMQGWWVIGCAIWLLAQVINLISMGLAPQAILSVLASWTIMCNVVIARLVLGEVVSSGGVLAMVGLLFGAVLVVIGAPRTMAPEVSGDVRVLSGLFLHRGFLVGTALLTGCFVLLQYLSGYFAAGGSRVKTSSLFWVSAAAVFSGYTSLLFKCVSLMVIALPEKAPLPWVSPWAYTILLSAMLCGVAEVHCLNLGLRIGDAVTMMPLYFSLGMLSQIMTNGIFFSEFGQFASFQQAVVFSIGVVVSLGFVVLLSGVRAKSSPK